MITDFKIFENKNKDISKYRVVIFRDDVTLAYKYMITLVCSKIEWNEHNSGEFYLSDEDDNYTFFDMTTTTDNIKYIIATGTGGFLTKEQLDNVKILDAQEFYDYDKERAEAIYLSIIKNEDYLTFKSSNSWKHIGYTKLVDFLEQLENIIFLKNTSKYKI